MGFEGEYGDILSVPSDTDMGGVEQYGSELDEAAIRAREALRYLEAAWNQIREAADVRRGGDTLFSRAASARDRERHAARSTLREASDGARSILNPERYAVDDLYRFCDRSFAQTDPSLGGVFVTAAANALDDEVRLPDMGGVPCVGYGNKGTLIIEGDAGPGLGFTMEGGRIDLYGDVNGSLGRGMCGGHIRVYGDCANVFRPQREGVIERRSPDGSWRTIRVHDGELQFSLE